MDRDKAIRAAKLTLGGMLEKNRHTTAVSRAGGQIAPSKYLPNVPRAVHADGGKVAFMQGNHPDVPPVMYHGTGAAKDFSSFSLPGNKTNRKTGGNAIYLSTSPETAGTFANYGESPRIIPAHVSAKNPFDFRNPDHLNALQGALTKNFKNWFPGAMYGPQTAMNWIKGSDFGLLENDNVRSWMKRRGHDSYFVTEGEGKPLNLAVFKPEQIKSAIGNQGTFDPNDPDITKAEGGAATAPMFQGIHPDLQGEDGAPIDLYHGTTQPKEFEAFDNAKLGARDAGFYGRGHYLTPDKSTAEEYAYSDRDDGTTIGPLHTALKNPYIWDVSDDRKAHSTLRDLQSMGIMKEKSKLDVWDNLQSHHIAPFMAEMQRRGHDGVVVKTGAAHLPNGISEVVAFNPNTIKHAEAEAFDPTDPRIRRDDGGKVDDGITAYHGSPHDFDQFDIGKLGMGTGHQAKGHGLYFAGDENDAKNYREMLKNNGSIDIEHESYKLGIPLDRDAQADLRSVSRNVIGDPTAAAKALQARNPATREMPQEKLANLIDQHRKSTTGHMYKVKLNVQPQELLDWDKPLSDQHPNVQAALSRTMPDYTIKNISGTPHAFANGKIIEVNPDGLTGRDAYVLSRMGKSTDGSSTHQDAKAASEHLLSEGIKGIRYREAGTHNYVMFHHDPVKVVDKYEYGGEVHKATGGTVMGYVPMASLPTRRLINAPIQPQQPQANVGTFSQSLNSLMDTVEGFKKKPEDAAPETAPNGAIPMPEKGYQASGMYAPFQSAIDRMIADAPGKISVTSGYRTPQRQEELWNEHAAQYPDPEVRDNYVARPGTSSHNYGLAADLSYADEAALKWAQENAARYGLNFRMGHEDWHIEPANIWELRNAMTVPAYAAGGEVDNNNVTDLSTVRTMRDINSGDHSYGAQNVMSELADKYAKSQKAFDAAYADGAFSNFDMGDMFKYKGPLKYDPKKIVGFTMKHVSSWPQATKTYNDHYPALEWETQNADRKVDNVPVEWLEDNMHKYEKVGGKPKIVRATGGNVNKALALTRGFTKDGKSAINTLKPKRK